MIWIRYLILMGLLAFVAMGLACAGYLDGGPDYSELRSHFSDPIFYSGGPPSKVDHSQYYPYFGSGIFKDTAPLGGSSREPIALGNVARGRAETRRVGSVAGPPPGSDPKYGRMIDPAVLPSRKNWTRTMDFAENRSSLRVFLGGNWTFAPDVQEAY